MHSSNSKTHCTQVRIQGMTCTSCEVMIERKFKTIPGVAKVEVNHLSGKCHIDLQPGANVTTQQLQRAVQGEGYTVMPWQETVPPVHRRSWAELGVITIIVLALYKLISATGLFSAAPSLGTSLSLGAVFVTGIAAALSTCAALVGGLVLTLSAKYTEAHPTATARQKLKPQLIFQLGRLLSYFVLGGVIGVIGKALTPSAQFLGILTVLIAGVMIILGIDILKLFQGKRFIPTMPKWISHKLYDLTSSNKPGTSFTLGALTFFVPCGFTQAMQLYALTTGSFWQGGLTMFVFALGTLPGLLSISAIASYTKGKLGQRLVTVSGVVVLLLGIYNINNGLNLLGWTTAAASSDTTAQLAAPAVNGTQVVNMAIQGLHYVPAQITVKQGVPVEWHIDSSQAGGCAAGYITAPSLGIEANLSPNQETVVTFTPTTTGTVAFTCSMGMTRGSFNVIP